MGSVSELASHYSQSAKALRGMADNDDDWETKSALLRVADVYERVSANYECGIVPTRKWRRG
jgi:hypothetical protein